jgi:hypothetical protein
MHFIIVTGNTIRACLVDLHVVPSRQFFHNGQSSHHRLPSVCKPKWACNEQIGEHQRATRNPQRVGCGTQRLRAKISTAAFHIVSNLIPRQPQLPRTRSGQIAYLVISAGKKSSPTDGAWFRPSCAQEKPFNLGAEFTLASTWQHTREKATMRPLFACLGRERHVMCSRVYSPISIACFSAPQTVAKEG